jgi:ABC-type nitrate/sulfonate/bicarbonate transport system substrate-binding protein
MSGINKRLLFLPLFLAVSLVMVACAPAQAPPTPAQPENKADPTPAESKLEALTFMAGFKSQANLPFVGPYLAKEQGFFEQNSLDVTIEHSAGRGEHVQLFVAGKVKVTTMDSATILQRRADPGLPVVSIALIGQKGRQAFAALASSGTRKDWEGKTVGYRGTSPPDLYVLLSTAGADINKMTLVNVGFDRACWSKARWMSIRSLSPTSRFCSGALLTS